jgi:hypothetical protein
VSAAGRGEFVRSIRSRLRLPGRSLEFEAVGAGAADAEIAEPIRIGEFERRATG